MVGARAKRESRIAERGVMMSVAFEELVDDALIENQRGKLLYIS